jgi:hypothetical protein
MHYHSDVEARQRNAVWRESPFRDMSAHQPLYGEILLSPNERNEMGSRGGWIKKKRNANKNAHIKD